MRGRSWSSADSGVGGSRGTRTLDRGRGRDGAVSRAVWSKMPAIFRTLLTLDGGDDSRLSCGGAVTERMAASFLEGNGPDSCVGLSLLSLLAGLVSCSFPLSSPDLALSSTSERSVSDVEVLLLGYKSCGSSSSAPSGLQTLFSFQRFAGSINSLDSLREFLLGISGRSWPKPLWKGQAVLS